MTINLFVASLPYDLAVTFSVDGMAYFQSGSNVTGAVIGCTVPVAGGSHDIAVETPSVTNGKTTWVFDHWEIGGNLQGLPCSPVKLSSSEFVFTFGQDTNVIAVFLVASVDSEAGFVSCPECNDAMVQRIGQTNRFWCPSCNTKFGGEGYALARSGRRGNCQSLW